MCVCIYIYIHTCVCVNVGMDKERRRNMTIRRTKRINVAYVHELYYRPLISRNIYSDFDAIKICMISGDARARAACTSLGDPCYLTRRAPHARKIPICACTQSADGLY
jgi:hypothetical protein